MSMQDFLNKYIAATADFEQALTLVNAGNIDRTVGDGWSAREVIHHMADAEAHSYLRLRMIVVEPGTAEINTWDEDAWSLTPRLAYTSADIDHSLQLVRASRAASADLLRRLSTDDLELAGLHSERGKFTIADWLEANINHAIAHANQLRECVG